MTNEVRNTHYKESTAHPTCTICDIGLPDSESLAFDQVSMLRALNMTMWLIYLDQHVLATHPDLYCDTCAVGFQKSRSGERCRL